MARRSRFMVFGLLMAVLGLIAPVSAQADPVALACSDVIVGDPETALIFAAPCILVVGDGFFVVQLYSEAEQVGGDTVSLRVLILGDGAIPAGCGRIGLAVNGEEQLPPEASEGTCLP